MNHRGQRSCVGLFQFASNVHTRAHLVIRKNSNAKVHNDEEDRRKERQAENETGGVDGMDGMVVMIPPNIKTRTQWLVTTIVKAEYLPVMDARNLQRKGGDFFTLVCSRPFESHSILATRSGRPGTMSICFGDSTNLQLRVPRRKVGLLSCFLTQVHSIDVSLDIREKQTHRYTHECSSM